MHIPAHRLHRQIVLPRRLATPARATAWFGAIQAQDYLAALWALGLRTKGATEAIIEAALAQGSIIRMHVFRGTWQYVARGDVRWMLRLSATGRSPPRRRGFATSSWTSGPSSDAASCSPGRSRTARLCVPLAPPTIHGAGTAFRSSSLGRSPKRWPTAPCPRTYMGS